MKTKPPPDRRKFANAWDEITYLYGKLLYWLYQREAKSKARPYADRLQTLLAKADADQESILGQECRSLIGEVYGDLSKAIAHRENEIRLMRRLHEISKGTPGESAALKNRGPADLSDRLDLLARLHHLAGDLVRAIATLQESQRLCADTGIKFDGADLLAEYHDEKRTRLNGSSRSHVADL